MAGIGVGATEHEKILLAPELPFAQETIEFCPVCLHGSEAAIQLSSVLVSGLVVR